jgi:hypothetical protein
MKHTLTLLSLIVFLAACKKMSEDAPIHLLPCDANYGTGNMTFNSQHYNLAQNYTLKKCEINMYFKTTNFRPSYDWYYGSLEIALDSLQMGIDSIKRFVVMAPGDTADLFADADTIPIRYYQLRMHTNISDTSLYAYVSNNEPGSYFRIAQLTDTTVTGSYFVHVSRMRTSPTGNNIDTSDHSIIQGTFTNLKIQLRSWN